MELAGIILLLLFLFIIMLTLIAAFILEFIGKFIAQAPFVPAPHQVARRVGELVSLKEGDVFYDLGSGEGQIVRSVALGNPTACVVGVEIAPLPKLIARILTPQKEFPNVHYLSRDLRTLSLTDATCVYLYLLPNLMKILAPKLKRELKSGAQIITCDFTLPGWEPLESKKVPCGRSVYTLHLYRQP